MRAIAIVPPRLTPATPARYWVGDHPPPPPHDRPSLTDESFRAVDPTTGKLIQEWPVHDEVELAHYLDGSRAAFKQWRRYSHPERAARLLRVGELLDLRRAEIASVVTGEMGKPIAEAEAEVDRAAELARFFAREAEGMLAPIALPSGDARRCELHFDPLGGILAIMPWNFPVWQVVRCALPALAAGNVLLLKHAPNVPGVAILLAELFDDAGFPSGAFANVRASEDRTCALIDDPAVAAVSLTGGVAAGRAVAARAGAALKKSILELGGSDPMVVLEDADVPAAARAAVQARMRNTGQSCLAPKRLIVVEPIADTFARCVAAELDLLRVGDPRDRTTQIGPLARADLRDALARQVTGSVEAGAVLVRGGCALERPGYYYAPTLLDRVRPGMPAFDEETFGPVAAIVRARDPEHAVELANRSCYGLGASVWSADHERARVLATRLDAGTVSVGDAVRSDPRWPFGGVKRSGYGREMGAHGLRELTAMKTIVHGG